MRVSTFNRYETAVDSLQRRQQELGQTQQQMTTGKRISRPSDDPTAISRAERAHTAQQRIAAQQRSVDASRSAMQLAESTLGQAGDVLQAARDIYTRRGEGLSIWIVPSNAITASDPADRDAMFEPTASKIYRHPTFYEVPDEVGNM